MLAPHRHATRSLNTYALFSSSQSSILCPLSTAASEPRLIARHSSCQMRRDGGEEVMELADGADIRLRRTFDINLRRVFVLDINKTTFATSLSNGQNVLVSLAST